MSDAREALLRIVERDEKRWAEAETLRAWVDAMYPSVILIDSPGGSVADLADSIARARRPRRTALSALGTAALGIRS